MRAATTRPAVVHRSPRAARRGGHGSVQMNGSSTRTIVSLATALCCAGLVAGCAAVSVAQPSYGDSTQSGLRLLVQAELRDALRLGLVTVGEEDVRSFSAAQRRMIEQKIEEATVGEVWRPD
jgi:hypothetical protein